MSAKRIALAIVAGLAFGAGMVALLFAAIGALL